MYISESCGSGAYVFGTEDRAEAAGAAGNCRFFRIDVEEELVVDETVSCYNCRYRRWTPDSFTCMKRKS
jgi:hypothetical protein